MDSSIRNIIITGKEYIPRLIDGIDLQVSHMKNKDETESSSLLSQILDGINWVYEAFDGINNTVDCWNHYLERLSQASDAINELLQEADYQVITNYLDNVFKPILKEWLDDIHLNDTVCLIFSKDRAMQLEAVLNSFQRHCLEHEQVDVKVIYKASSPFYKAQYEQIVTDNPNIDLVEEMDFRTQVLQCLEGYNYVLFSVDDNLFIKSFSIKYIQSMLQSHPDALGFSLRLGTNTTYCYTRGETQKVPPTEMITDGTMKFKWTEAKLDFGYPLEVSSSVYHALDIYDLFSRLDFKNPNTLEAVMDMGKHIFQNTKPILLSFDQSHAFGYPVNVVQNVFYNKAGEDYLYTVENLAKLFEQGYRIDIHSFDGFVPNACHQEVKLSFQKAKSSMKITHDKPEFDAWFRDDGDKTVRLNYDLNDKSVVFDLGGYEGQWASDIFAKYCCDVHVFEPVKSFSDKIAKRFSKNPKIHLYKHGLSSKTENTEISISNDSSSTFKSQGQQETILLVKAEDFFMRHTFNEVDLIKINIEGGEYDLLEHLIDRGLITKFKNIQVQFHQFVNESEARMKKIQSLLNETHYLTYQYYFVWENWSLK